MAHRVPLTIAGGEVVKPMIMRQLEWRSWTRVSTSCAGVAAGSRHSPHRRGSEPCDCRQCIYWTVPGTTCSPHTYGTCCSAANRRVVSTSWKALPNRILMHTCVPCCVAKCSCGAQNNRVGEGHQVGLLWHHTALLW